MTGCIRQILLTACLCGTLGSPCLAGQTSPAENPQEKPFASQKLLWSQMTLQEKTMLWPMLTNQERMQHWRYMSKAERQAMRYCMTPDEKKVFRDRFLTQNCCGNLDGQRKVRRMTPEERQMLRNQVREVHSRMREGLNYSCTDPTDCPSSPLADPHARHVHSMLHARNNASAEDSGLPPLPSPSLTPKAPISNVLIGSPESGISEPPGS